VEVAYFFLVCSHFLNYLCHSTVNVVIIQAIRLGEEDLNKMWVESTDVNWTSAYTTRMDG